MTCVIAVTAGITETGSTTVATGLAIALSRHGQRVCLLDADWGPGSASQLLDVQPEKTLANLLDGQTELEQVLQTDICGIDVVFGDPASERTLTLDAGQIRGIARQLSALSNYDYLIIDVAPGQNRSITSFLEASNLVLFVITPDIKTQDGTFNVLKRLPGLISDSAMTVVNRCRNSIFGNHANARFREISEFYLQKSPPLLGLVCEVDRQQYSSQEVLEDLYSTDADLDVLASKILSEENIQPAQSIQEFWERYLNAAGINDGTAQSVNANGSLETQLDDLSSRVATLINRVHEYKNFTSDVDVIATNRPAEPALVNPASGPEYWLGKLKYRTDPEGQAHSHFYRIQQPSGKYLRCAYYNPETL